MRIMMCNNPNLNLINMNAYIKFGDIMSISSQDIEQKQNSGVINSDTNLLKMTGNNPNLDIVNNNAYA